MTETTKPTHSPTSDSIFSCKHCEKQFTSQQALEMHVNAKHAVPVQPKGENPLAKHKLTLIGAGIALIILWGVWTLYVGAVSGSGVGAVGSTHIHMDIKVYLDGVPVNFGDQKYQLRAQQVHFESGDGDVFHVHATGVTLGYLFETLGGRLSETCISLDGVTKCNDGTKTLKFYVNGQPNNQFGKYLPRSLDKLSVSYGSETSEQIQRQLATVTDKAKNEENTDIANPLAAHAAG